MHMYSSFTSDLFRHSERSINLVSVSINEYVLYMAENLGESHLPSPDTISDLFP